MTAKEYLKQARMLDIEINTKLEELHQLRLKASCVQSVAISERVQSSKQNSTNNVIDKIIDLENEINAEIDKLIDLKAEIKSKIMRLSDITERIVLTERYINGKDWDKIASITNYTDRQVYRIHGRALQHFSKCQ